MLSLHPLEELCPQELDARGRRKRRNSRHRSCQGLQLREAVADQAGARATDLSHSDARRFPVAILPANMHIADNVVVSKGTSLEDD